jgi:hypothetical protein
MKIIFKQTEELKKLTFADVQQNQFFVDSDGDLCQKYVEDSYFVIASNAGTPSAMYIECVDKSKPIRRILPIVEMIEF